MKERPILFTPANVKAILAGRKTQTRRVIKPQPNDDWHPDPVRWYPPTMIDKHGEEYPGADVYGASDEDEGRVSPYGIPGDRLYVKEGWGLGGARLIDPTVNYRAGGQLPLIDRLDLGHGVRGNKYGVSDADLVTIKDGWHNAMFMPKWAARLWLEIEEVRIERVQDISEFDAKEEGTGVWFESHPHEEWDGDPNQYRKGYRELWDSINGKREGGRKTHDKAHAEERKSFSWSRNPWVWVMEFKPVK